MTNVFGPQGANASLSLPPGGSSVRYGLKDTWVKDCDAAGRGGTKLNDAFFNNFIGNLNYVVTMSGVAAAPGDHTALYRAIKGMVGGTIVQDLAGNVIGRVV